MTVLMTVRRTVAGTVMVTIIMMVMASILTVWQAAGAVLCGRCRRAKEGIARGLKDERQSDPTHLSLGKRRHTSFGQARTGRRYPRLLMTRTARRLVQTDQAEGYRTKQQTIV
jgi:hypothetical protein